MKMQNYIQPTFIPDESFSSWMHRLSIKTTAQQEARRRFEILQFSTSPSLDWADPDFTLPELFEHEIRDVFGIKEFDAAFFRAESSWIIPDNQSDYACQACLAASLLTHEKIVLRKSWRYVSYPVCPLHRELLTDFGWPRKLDHLQYLMPPASPLRIKQSPKAVTLIIDLALPIQSKMLDLEARMLKSFEKTPQAISDEYIARKALMEFFLHSAEIGGGLATQFITAHRSKNCLRRLHGSALLMKIGPLESNAAERACALVMMGIVTGCINNEKIRMLNREAPGCYGLRSWDPINLGKLCSQIIAGNAFGFFSYIEFAISHFKNSNCRSFANGLRFKGNEDA